MRLQHYLERVGYRGVVRTDYACLRGIHRAQAFAIPYENLDVQLGRPLDFDIERIFRKIVDSRRGGWCYETHILLAWALKEIGFDVTTVTAGIHRHEHGDIVLGNHTALLVRLDRTYLADLGLGDGIRDPIPLEKGTFRQGPLQFRLERLEDGYWRFHNHSLAWPTTFDFRDQPADWDLLAQHNRRQQTDPTSVLVANFICQVMRPASLTCLTGRLLREKSQAGTTKRLVAEAEFVPLLADVFGVRDEAIPTIWPRVAARHEQLFGVQTEDQIVYDGF
ncbi:MAG: arylamine N-acetyltransferase [Hyphomicrobiales bacterium]